MTATDIIVFISIMAAGILFFWLLLKNRRKKKKIIAGEDGVDVFLKHLDNL